MKYIVASTAVTDEITFSNGQVMGNAGGGAGWYAYSGMRLWTDRALLVSGVGRDFLSLHGDWFERNRADTSGLIVKTDHSPLTKVQYHSNGERTEIPAYGLEHYRVVNPSPEDLEPFCSDCKGMYLFRNVDDLVFWKDLFDLKKRYGFRLMWEIAADAAIPEWKERILIFLKDVDILSINRSEAKTLFAMNEHETIEEFKKLNLPLVFYRKGEEGALLIRNGSITAVPSVAPSSFIDPTGAGNSSSGAVLVGYCEGYSPEHIGMMGSISAGYMISQYGPIPFISDVIKNEAQETLNNKIKGLHKNGGKYEKQI